MRALSIFRLFSALAAAMLAGCASVATEVTVLDPARKLAPTQSVVILLDYPARPYTKIAFIEARGGSGGSISSLLEEARKQARSVGADALVRQEITSVYQPPVRVYDPAFANPPYSSYRYPSRSFYGSPYAFSPYPFDNYRWVGGGNVQTLKAVAIKYTDGHIVEPPTAP